MGKVKEFNGNDYVYSTLEVNQINQTDMNNLLNFVKEHKNIYLFGEGACGTGMAHYLSVCGFKNIRGNITSVSFNQKLHNYKMNEDGIILALKSDYYPEVLPIILDKIKISDILFLKENTKNIFVKTFSKEYIKNNMWISLPLALHCNINCASCNMFSPLCDKEIYLLEDIKRDLTILKKNQVNFTRFNITGGEPFLNTDILKILRYIRSEFAEKKIDLYTNGIIMSSLSDEDLRILSEYKIEFHITEYAGTQKYLNALYPRLDRLGIQYVLDYMDDNKLFYKKIIDFDKKVPIYNYINCQYYTYCFSFFIYNGKMYKCPMAMQARNINMYTDKKIEITEKDYLDLNKINSTDQIYDFWKTRMPMCDYCPRVNESIRWRKSEKKIEEWL